jgi:hypothetical protein
MVGDGGISAPASTKVFSPSDPSAPAKSRRMPTKKILIPVLAAVLVLGGAAAFYFGYYMNPSVIYGQSLKNTGKGYDTLVNYADQQSKASNQGYTGAGTYKITSSSVSTDGKLAFKGDGQNDDLTFDLGLGASRVNGDIRTIKSAGTSPDIYLKAGNIKGLGTVMGLPELDPELAKLDNNWIVIDHTLIDSLNAQAAQANTSTATSPTREQILDEARAFGRVNQQYLFSTAKDKAVMKVVKKYGVETVGGHKAYHYKVALQKDNVKKYILAQKDALKSSQLNDWLKKNKYDTAAYAAFDDSANSTKDIKTSDTFDLWSDVNQRVVYKVRFNGTTNPADNYVDVGLDYKGGTNYPFFIASKSKTSGQTTDFSIVTTVNTKSSNTDLKLNLKTDGSNGVTLTSDFNFKPSTTAIKIDKPANAIPLSQVLSDLGLGDILSGASAAPVTTNGPVTVQLSNKLFGIGKTTGTPAKPVQSSPLQYQLNYRP